MSQCICCGAALLPQAVRCVKCGNALPLAPALATSSFSQRVSGAAQSLAQAVDCVLPQSKSLRYCNRCRTSTPEHLTASTKGRFASSWWEKLLLVGLLIGAFPIGIVYALYLYYRRVWVCPHCGAKDSL